MGWSLAVDFGTTYTAAAMRENGEARTLSFADGATRMPSLVWLDDEGEILVGEDAFHQSALAPERVEREPKALLGRSKQVFLGDREVEVAELVGEVIAEMVSEARRQHADREPSQVTLTHPAEWGERRKQALSEAARRAGVADPKLVSEPEAAALFLASDIEVGEKLAVYDLGGGTFDTAVLQRIEEGFSLLGKPGGDDNLGGERFDDRLVAYVGQQIAAEHPDQWEKLLDPPEPHWARRAALLRADVRRAKEQLSRQERTTVFLPLEHEDKLMLRRAELEELIDSDIERSVELLEQTVDGAGLSVSELKRVYLTGGSSRLRIVQELVGRRCGERLRAFGDPKTVVALGAVGWEAGRGTVEPRPPLPDRVAHARRTLRASERRRGRDDPATIDAREALAALLVEWGEDEEARWLREDNRTAIARTYPPPGDASTTAPGAEDGDGRRPEPKAEPRERSQPRYSALPSEGKPAPPPVHEERTVVPTEPAFAGWGQRVAAQFIDGMLLFFVILVVSLQAGWLVGFFLGSVMVLGYGGATMCRTGPRNGQTLGKQAVAIRVVRVDGRPVATELVALREMLLKYLLFGCLGFLTLYLDYLWPLWDQENRALHDMMSSTRVMRD